MFWQSLATMLFVALAALIAGRKMWMAIMHRSDSACGGCGGCSSKGTVPQLQVTPLIQLGQSLEMPKSARSKHDRL